MKYFFFLTLCFVTSLFANDYRVFGLGAPCFVAAKREINEKDLDQTHFEGANLVYLSGHCLSNGMYIEKVFALAKKANAIISLDLADAHLAEQFRERLWNTIPAYVDILFANKDEAYALTQLPPKQSAVFLKNFCLVAVVKAAEDGCWVCSDKGLFHSSGISTQVVDKTGAGDLFTSAFLYAYLKGESLERCAYLGNLTGSAAVEQYGTELSNERWTEILRKFEISDCIQTDISL